MSAAWSVTTTRPPTLIALPSRSYTIACAQQPSSRRERRLGIAVLGRGADNALGGGAFLGYNTQWQDLIIGVEATYAHTNLNTTAPASAVARIFPSVNNEVALNANGRLDLTDYGEVRARAGYVVGNLLPYGFVGVAVGRANYSVTTTADVTQSMSTTSTPDYSCAGLGAAGSTATCQDFTFLNSVGQNNALLWGFSVGVGLDWALTQNFFLRGEFEFVQFAPISNINLPLVSGRARAGFKF